MSITRIDGHGCDGCYNLRSNGGVNYCYAYEVSATIENINGIAYLKILYRIVDTDLYVRPIWCPYNSTDNSEV